MCPGWACRVCCPVYPHLVVVDRNHFLYQSLHRGRLLVSDADLRPDRLYCDPGDERAEGLRRTGGAVYPGLRRHSSNSYRLVRPWRPECPAGAAADPALCNRFFDRRRDLVSLGLCTGPGPLRCLGAGHDRGLRRAPFLAPAQRAASTRRAAHGRALRAVHHHRDGRGVCQSDQQRARRAACGYRAGAGRTGTDHRRRNVVDLLRQRRRLAGQTGGTRTLHLDLFASTSGHRPDRVRRRDQEDHIPARHGGHP